MNNKTSPGQRQEFYQRHQQGQTYEQIADAYGLSEGCIRYWCRRQREGGSCVTHYHRAEPGLLQRFDPLVRYGILRLRLSHPHWGPAYLRQKLAKWPCLQGKRLPCVAQIGRYLHQWPRFRRRRKHPVLAKERVDAATQVHQRWQLDFKLGLALQDDSQVNLHTVRDPVGEVCIVACVTPAGPAGHVPRRVTVSEVQATLRAGFARWHTLPAEVQTDNEAVLVGNPGDAFPSLLTLWLKGLGIEHLMIRPGQPTDNAAVERCHQTICNCAIIGPDATKLAHLQAVLDQAVTELAWEVPSRAPGCRGQPPVLAHPELLQPRRLFAPEQEWEHFDLRQVDAFLASFLWCRRVGKTGQVTLGGNHRYYSVGRAYAGQDVLVCFDPADRHFVFLQATEPYAEIQRRLARCLEVTDLTGLQDPAACLGPQQLPLPFIEGVSC